MSFVNYQNQVVVKPRASPLATVDRLLSNNSDVLHTVSCIRRDYETELEQVLESEVRSEKNEMRL